MSDVPEIKIPADLLPSDGRFGSGPSKIRQPAVDALADVGSTLLGTSHRKAPVKNMVGRLRSGMSELFSLPDGYEVVLGNGGTTIFWDSLVFGFIERKSQHLTFGEFSSKFAKEAKSAPFLDEPEVISSETGTHPAPIARDDIDTYALTHNETSTGVSMEVVRPHGASGLVVVDGTSAAGGLRVDSTQFDCYYLAPQKSLASDGGLWMALMSPAAIERARKIASTDRWIPEGISLTTAIDNSLQNQTYNTPALATIFLAVQQVEWINTNGGLEWSASRCDQSSEILYSWAESSNFATPFVAKPDERSHTVGTIDFSDEVNADTVSAVLRSNGIVDTDSYRKLGRNQLRIAMFPAIEPSDISQLTKCIDYIVGELS